MNETFKINIYFDEKGEEYVQKLGWKYQLKDTYIDQILIDQIFKE